MAERFRYSLQRKERVNLKRCPRCGREPYEVIEDCNGRLLGYEIGCINCGLHTGMCETRAQAVTEWNGLMKGK